MIKYIGSKRTLAPTLGAMAEGAGARTALDLFTGTTRVAREFKSRGIDVIAADLATYSAVLAECYIATDAAQVDVPALDAAIDELRALPGVAGYFTHTFCEQARFFQPRNGARVDAIRDAIDVRHPPGDPLRPLLLTSLMLAADRVDSTTGVQMAYLKSWSPRSHNDLDLRRPDLLAGTGASLRGDARDVVDAVPAVDLAYLDPPYNQHRYFTNYHVWETLVRWDRPEHYGVACKRVDSRDEATRSVFNSRRTMPAALAELIARTRAELLVVSYNDESWLTAADLSGMLRDAGHPAVRVLGFDRARYVGALIGGHDRSGQRVGAVGRRRNVEYLFVAGEVDRVDAAVAATRPTVPE